MAALLPFLLATAQVAQTAPPMPPMAGAPQTLQQRFDAATAKLAAKDCAAALPAFAALEGEAGVRKTPSVLAVVRLRKGLCQVRTGATEEGIAAIAASLPPLEKDEAAFREDLIEGRLTLARTMLGAYDYAGAEPHLAWVLARSKGEDRIIPLALLTHLTMFDGTAQPLAYADEALGIAEAKGGDNSALIAGLHTNRARVLLNQGRHGEGYDALKQALQLQGGLDRKVSFSDIATRSDLAIAALLNDDANSARKYLAYTGAGRMREAPFGRAVSLRTPLCSGEPGLRPGDRTIVEFAIADDGIVSSASPIYATGTRAAAIEFARAVRSWSWKPEDLGRIPPLFRAATRVELRCSTVGDPPTPLSVLEADVDRWLQENGLPPVPRAESEAEALALARLQLAENEGTNPRARLGPLLALGANPRLAEAERLDHFVEAERIAAEPSSPPALRTLLGLQLLDRTKRIEQQSHRRYQAAVRRLLEDASLASDAHSAATLRLILARDEFRGSPADDADALLATIVADDRLERDDPLRVAALLEQASRAAKKGELDRAQRAFESTGLTEQQCALVGLQPAMRSSGGNAISFPDAAMQWGFEGWVKTEFDVLTNGRTSAERAIVAYPPFVFNDAALQAAKAARFNATYRPSGDTVCTGWHQNVFFQLPR